MAQVLDSLEHAIAKQLELQWVRIRRVGSSEQPIPHLAGPVYVADFDIRMVEDMRMVAHEEIGQRINLMSIQTRQRHEARIVQHDYVFLESSTDLLPLRPIKVALHRVLEEFRQDLNDAR